MEPKISLKLASEEDIEALTRVGASLFDFEIKNYRLLEFLEDPRHHLVIALHDRNVIGMASGIHYIHPDKDPELFINELGVLEQYRGKGLGRKLIKSLVAHGKEIGCKAAWVITDSSNKAAKKTYMAAGGMPEDGEAIIYNF